MYWRVTFFFLQPVVVYSQVKAELSQALTTQSLTAIRIAAPGCWKPLKVKPSLWVTCHNCVHSRQLWEVPSEFWGTDLRKFGKSEMWRNEISSHWLYLKDGMKITQQTWIVLSEKQKDPRITWSLNTALNSPLNNDFLCLQNWNNSFY